MQRSSVGNLSHPRGTRQSSLEHWESYYRSGALASCPLGPAAGYTLELHEVWVEFFAALKDGARILDIGTGNGAIALIAAETACRLGRRYDVHGTDLARIDPVRDVHDGANLFSGIHFHARVPTERLPFSPASFDAVSGQYALEYAVVETALTEIARVLKRGGRAQFIMHHHDSIILHNARESLEHTSIVLKDTKIFRKLRRYLEAELRSPAAARRTGEELMSAVSQLQMAAGEARSPLTLHMTIDAVQKLLNARKQLSRAVIDRQIDRVENEVRVSARRLRDLVASAQSEECIEKIRVTAAALGFGGCDVRIQLHAGTNLVGWRVNFGKA